MRQTVTVTALSDDGKAEISLVRRSACSGDCGSCGGCSSFKEVVSTNALNLIGAAPGDRVIVESDAGFVLYAALLVYVIPIVLFFTGYGLGSSLFSHPGLFGLAGFLAGIPICVVVNKKMEQKKETPFRLIAFAEKDASYLER